MKSLEDEIVLRNRLIANLEEADFECAAPLRAPLLNFVVAGGGFTGVETIAAMNDFLREAVQSFPHLREDMLRIILVNSRKIILPELGEKLGAYAQRKLMEQKVEIHSNCKVVAVTDREVTLSDGTTVTTNTLVWTAYPGTHFRLPEEDVPVHDDRATGPHRETDRRGQHSWGKLFRLHCLVAVEDDLLAETAPI